MLVPYVIHSVPESKINGDLLNANIEKCIKDLYDIGFRVTAVVSDNHSSNVDAFNKLTIEYGRDNDSLRVWISDQPKYLFYDTGHLVKYLRNNLLTNRQLLFSPFICDDMEQELKIERGVIAWSLLHKVHEKDMENKANLRAAPKLNTMALHPGNYKQSVPIALAIFDPRPQDSTMHRTLLTSFI